MTDQDKFSLLSSGKRTTPAINWSDPLSVGSWALTDVVTSEAIFSLLHESDRAAAILACTLLEHQLEGKLRSALRDSTLFETLFGTGRPLNFFVARNQLAYLMGIYEKPFYSELETISTIRNKFAHSFADKKGRPVKTFKSPVIKDLCDKLCLLEPLLRAKEDRATSTSGPTQRSQIEI